MFVKMNDMVIDDVVVIPLVYRREAGAGVEALSARR